MKTIGEKIRSIRILKGYSQENMAEMLDVSLPTYAEIERGKRDVTISRLEQIAEKLGVTLNDVLSFEERIANFFDKCTGTQINTGENASLAQTNNDNDRELQLQIEKLQLELQLLQTQKEKAELETNYWRQLAEKR
jgi:transcriptional regulator with XRE-family HTH domain